MTRGPACGAAGMAAVSLLVLLAIAATHPTLRFVDFIAFSERVERLYAGQPDLLHPLYPAGYPLLVLLGRFVIDDVLIVGKVLSAAAGAGAVYAASRWLSPWAGLWLLGQAAVLTWGATEGTDLMATAFVLGAVATAPSRPGLSGALLGAACMTRYTALTAAPVVIGLGRAGWRPLAGMFLLTTAPHWGYALLSWRSPLPDQSENLAIGGHTGGLLSAQSLIRLPGGVWFSFVAATWAWTTRLGVLGVFIGMLQRDARAFALAAVSLLHMAAVGLAFANPRLVLPATICLSLGAFWLLPRRWMLLIAGAIALTLNARPALTPDPQEASLARVSAIVQDLDGPFLTTSPWFHQHQGGWLRAGILVHRVHADGHWIQPEPLRDWAIQHNVRYVALDIVRARRDYPALTPLLRRNLPGGYTKIASPPGWRILEISLD